VLRRRQHGRGTAYAARSVRRAREGWAIRDKQGEGGRATSHRLGRSIDQAGVTYHK
jgi:hypothetical protein